MQILNLYPTYNINCFLSGFTGYATMKHKGRKITFSFASEFYSYYENAWELTKNRIKWGYAKRLDFIGYKRTQSDQLKELLNPQELKATYKKLSKLINKEKHKKGINQEALINAFFNRLAEPMSA